MVKVVLRGTVEQVMACLRPMGNAARSSGLSRSRAPEGRCRSFGRRDARERPWSCVNCNGTGRNLMPYLDQEGLILARVFECNVCGGKGVAMDRTADK